MQYNPTQSSKNDSFASSSATQRCSQRRYNMAEPLKPYIDQYLDNHDLPEEKMEDGAQLFNLALFFGMGNIVELNPKKSFYLLFKKSGG